MPTYIYFVLYKLKELTHEEEERARNEWEKIRRNGLLKSDLSAYMIMHGGLSTTG